MWKCRPSYFGRCAQTIPKYATACPPLFHDWSSSAKCSHTSIWKPLSKGAIWLPAVLWCIWWWPGNVQININDFMLICLCCILVGNAKTRRSLRMTSTNPFYSQYVVVWLNRKQKMILCKNLQRKILRIIFGNKCISILKKTSKYHSQLLIEFGSLIYCNVTNNGMSQVM